METVNDQNTVGDGIVEAELKSIAAISFVPSEVTRQSIYATAKAAKVNPTLCSKLTPPDSKDGKVDPSKSVLVKIAMGQPLPWAPNGMPQPTIYNGKFAVLKDDFPPLLPSVHSSGALKGSNGPNGVMVAFGDSQRINLFDTNDAKTRSLLNTYLEFRDTNKKAIFDLTLAQMTAAEETPEEYQTTVNILRKIRVLPDEEFNATIGVVSFCQTWAASDVAGSPQFSVESPHFQTRFFIKSLAHVHLTALEAHAYVKTVQAHDARMEELGYTGAFVNLDDLAAVLAP